MLVEALNWLAQQTRPETVTVGEIKYSTSELYVPEVPLVKPIETQTLSAIRDYFLHAEGMTIDDSCHISVVSPSVVRVSGTPIFPTGARNIYIIADCKYIIGSPFRFGEFMDPEMFVIELLTKFQDTEDRQKLLKVVGNIKSEQVLTSVDNGVSQTVTTRSGVSRVEEVEVSVQYQLRPHRTFPEVVQPESEFVFRMRPGQDGGLPKCALFDSDGGRWKLDAISNIKEWLEAELNVDYSLSILA